jgi:hypothetical protein
MTEGRKFRLPSSPSLFSKGESNLLDTRLKKIAESIEKISDDDEHKHFLENIRLSVKSFMNKTIIGKLYFEFMTVLNLLSCMEYIYTTYLHYAKPNHLVYIHFCRKIELYAAAIYCFDWAFNLFLADHRSMYLISSSSVIDILSIVSIYGTNKTICPHVSEHVLTYSFRQIVDFILCGLDTTRMLRALRIRNRFELIEDEVERFLTNMAFSIVMLILFSKLPLSSPF